MQQFSFVSSTAVFVFIISWHSHITFFGVCIYIGLRGVVFTLSLARYPTHCVFKLLCISIREVPFSCHLEVLVLFFVLSTCFLKICATVYQHLAPSKKFCGHLFLTWFCRKTSIISASFTFKMRLLQRANSETRQAFPQILYVAWFSVMSYS